MICTSLTHCKHGDDMMLLIGSMDGFKTAGGLQTKLSAQLLFPAIESMLMT